MRDHLKSKFPNARIRTINAGMASTDSAWGSKRVGRDLMVDEPDLIFVEFAVNDGKRGSAPDMERIVRKIHEANSGTEVVFIYTTSDSAFQKLSQGKLPPAIIEHEKVAKHYAIPSVVLGSDLYKKIHVGEWSWRDFSDDACHPTQAGYNSYSRDLVVAVDEILEKSGTIPPEFPAPLVSGFESRSLEQPTILPSKEIEMKDSKGRVAELIERMPAFVFEWSVDSTFKNFLGSEWRLEYAVFDAMPGENAQAAQDAKWSPARWFQEAGGFTGKRSRLLAESERESGSKLKVAPYLSGGSVEVPQIVWMPSRAGDCILEVSVSKIQGHVNGSSSKAGLDVFLSSPRVGIQRLASVAEGEGKPLNLRTAFRIAPGDTVLLRPFAHNYEYFEFDGFDVLSKFFDTPP